MTSTPNSDPKFLGSTPSCEWVVAQLPLFLDGELPPERGAYVSNHLDVCPACRDEQRAELELIMSTVDTLVAGAPPANFTAQIMDGIPEATAPSLARSLGLWAKVAAAILLLVAGASQLPWAPAPVEPETPPSVEIARVGTPPAIEIDETPDPAPAAVVEHQFTPAPRYIPTGDIDADGKLTHADLNLLNKFLQDPTGVEAPCLAAADYDGDRQITPNDSVGICEAIMNNITPEHFLRDLDPEVTQLPCEAEVCL